GISQNQLEPGARVSAQAVISNDGRIGFVTRGADTVKKEIHRAQARHVVYNLDTAQSIKFEVALLVFVKIRVVVDDVVMRCQEKATRPTSRITDRFTWRWPYHVHNGFD